MASAAPRDPRKVATDHARLRQESEILELDIFELQQRLDNRKEDLESTSDALINNLQTLKSVEARLAQEKDGLHNLEASPSRRTPERMTLDRMLEISKRPWETLPENLSATASRPSFEQALVGELSQICARMEVLGNRLEDPFEEQRRLDGRGRTTDGDADLGVVAALNLMRRNEGATEGRRRDAAGQESLNVVRDEGAHAVVTVNLSMHTSFRSVLEYVCAYWDLESADYSLYDSSGLVWPLQADVRESLARAPEVNEVYLRLTHKIQDEDAAPPPAQPTAASASGRGSGRVNPLSSVGGQGRRTGAAGLGTGAYADEALLLGSDEPAVTQIRAAEDGAQKSTQGGSSDLHASSKLGADLQRVELEQHFHRGYQFSLHLLRNHCEIFLYFLLVVLSLIISFFSTGSYDAQPMVQTLESALLMTPFPPCASCAASGGSTGTLKTFASSATADDMYGFLEGPVRSLLTFNESTMDSSYSHLPATQGYNLLATKVLLQQVRVEQQCINPPELADLSCYPAMKDGVASRDAYSIGVASENDEDPGAGVDAFRYSAGDTELWPGLALESLPLLGDRVKLSQGGFQLELDMDASIFDQQVDALRDNGWIDAQTRAVILNANFYNPNLDLFGVVIVVFQYTTSAGVIPLAHIACARLTSWEENSGVETAMAFAILAIYFFLLLLVGLDFAVSRNKRRFVRRPRILIELALFVVLMVSIGGQLASRSRTRAAVDRLDLGVANGPYVELRGLILQLGTMRGLLAVGVLLLVLKGTLYLSLNPEISFLAQTGRTALPMLNQFTFVFVVVLVAFAALGHFLFGRNDFSFYEMDVALYAVVALMLGHFDLNALSPISSTNAWVTTYGYVVFFLGSFGLYRVFVAIVAQSYSRNMDRVRRDGFYWLPSVNQEYRMHRANERPYLSKLRVSQRYGLSDLDPDPLIKAKQA